MGWDRGWEREKGVEGSVYIILQWITNSCTGLVM